MYTVYSFYDVHKRNSCYHDNMKKDGEKYARITINVNFSQIKDMNKGRFEMKKLCTLLAGITLTGAMMPVVAQAAEAEPNVNSQQNYKINNNQSYIDSNQYHEGNEISPEEHDRLIEKMEQFLSVEDGELVFEDVPFSIYADYGYDIVRGLVEGIEVINDLAQNDIIEINKDFS